MTKKTSLISILVVVIIAGAFVGVAFSRGAISFIGWRPHFSMIAFKNPRPSLDRHVTYPVDFTPDARKIFDTKISGTRAALKANPGNISAWFDLAIEYRMVADYAGAVEIWKYVSAIHPDEGISLHNLGEYYFHTAKDYPAAEEYYMRSIAVAPQLTQNYSDLADMYTYVYKQDTSATVDILKQGISKTTSPENLSLIAQLAGYYANKNDTKDARVYYEQALQIAESMKNPNLAAQIKKSISQLK
ncbi:tetratricopeptide repeat protein [Candidatus Kaiserbacteria bacterium]|nr:tetratricopeptide repeat protein [Candidatus Kaiserbacteria bacterium]